jgi:hypothetical protein
MPSIDIDSPVSTHLRASRVLARPQPPLRDEVFKLTLDLLSEMVLTPGRTHTSGRK